MTEIGETLRETRMRRRIDMTEVEAATKIRAKYLRALENEEWDLLPGPTFVKTFLRTYAEYLELDPRLLVEEYRQRFERPTTQDLTPFRPNRNSGGRQRQRPRRPIGPFIVVALGIVIVLAALYVLGRQGPDESAELPVPTNTPTATPTATPTRTPEPGSSSKDKKKATPTRISLKLTATDRVYVCLVDATGKSVIDGQYLEKGASTKTFRSQYFRVNLGNSSVRMSYGGKRYNAANTGEPIGYELRPGKKPKRLKESVRTGLCAN